MRLLGAQIDMDSITAGEQAKRLPRADLRERTTLLLKNTLLGGFGPVLWTCPSLKDNEISPHRICTETWGSGIKEEEKWEKEVEGSDKIARPRDGR